MPYPDYDTLFQESAGTVAAKQAYRDMLNLFALTAQPEQLKTLLDVALAMPHNPDAFETFQRAYYTAPRHDELRNWLVPVLFLKDVSTKHIDWVISCHSYSFEELWVFASSERLADVISALDPTWESQQRVSGDSLREKVLSYGLTPLIGLFREARDAYSL